MNPQHPQSEALPTSDTPRRRAFRGRTGRWRTVALVGTLTAAFTVVAVGAVGATSRPAETVTSCVDKKDGEVRIVRADDWQVSKKSERTCDKDETSVSWDGSAARAAQEARSYREITNLEHRFIELLDQRDLPALAAMFTHGSFELRYGSTPLKGEGEEGVLRTLRMMFPRPPVAGEWSRHIVANLVVDIDEQAGTATARQYSSAWGVREGKPSHFRGLGTHWSTFKRINGVWYFTGKIIRADVDYPYPAA